MLRVNDDEIILSASDLTAAAACEWALMRRLDVQLGRKIEVPTLDDPMLTRVAALGDAHEQRVLEELITRHGLAVQIERPKADFKNRTVQDWRDGMQAAVDATSAALSARAPLVYQGAVFDGGFQGFADFLVLSETDGTPRYEVWDSKLARKTKIIAVLQLAAYVDQLERIGVPVSSTARLVLGSDMVDIHGDKAPYAQDVRDVIPVYRDRRRHLEELVRGRVDDPNPTPWNDDRYVACGRCDVCTAQVDLHEDVLLVAGLTLRQRQRLRAAGIETMTQLAAASTAPDVPATTLAKLRAQADLQLEQRADPEGPLPRVVYDRRPIDLLPPADPGDLFFDFEGDPLYEEKGRWGIDYLFGTHGMDVNPGAQNRTFLPLWAENLAEERDAFTRFMEFVAARRAAFPNMHIYHYASYEKTHLLSIAARHQRCVDEVDDLLRDGVLVDLLTVVKRSLRIGADSYSIKALEPLYMTEDKRTGTKNAVASIVEFSEYVDAKERGDAEDAAARKADIIQYNEYDCRSTVGLRDWLLAAREGAPSSPAPEEKQKAPAEPDTLAESLLALIEDVPVEDRTAAQTAVALAAAAIAYHRREDKRFWQEHFSRLEGDLGDWADQRGVISIGPGEARVVTSWHKPTAGSGVARVVELTGTIAPGTSLHDADTGMYVVYDPPYPEVPSLPSNRRPAMRLAHNRTTVGRVDGPSGLVLTERLGKGGVEHELLPIALTPRAPFDTGSIEAAVRDWATRLLEHLRSAPSVDGAAAEYADAAFDVLLRRAPLVDGLLPDADGSTSDAIVSSLQAISNGTIAVQGPPGTGKTRTGSEVIAELIRRGWNIGVVAQSHTTVENLLDAVIERGVEPSLVGKAPKDEKDVAPRAWTKLRKNDIPDFLAGPRGRVLGGTAWTFTNRNQVGVKELDLLVIDEAGQYSLANTIGVSLAAKRMLLLGDPQQLPQVTQGTHPEPVDVAALAWLSDGHAVLPPRFGYFLAQTWRMVDAVCAPVSELSYDGRLHPAPAAEVRHLDGVVPGLRPIPVDHAGNDTSSEQEAAVVLEIVENLLGRSWLEHAPGEPPVARPLTGGDLIVVAAYNAQVDLLAERLRSAGHADIQVGTVDRFQGREAVVSIVSLAASSADEVPRGIEFLLMPNRLNVAISRAKWAAHLVYSPGLARHLPTNLPALEMLGKFLRLVTPH